MQETCHAYFLEGSVQKEGRKITTTKVTQAHLENERHIKEI